MTDGLQSIIHMGLRISLAVGPETRPGEYLPRFLALFFTDLGFKEGRSSQLHNKLIVIETFLSLTQKN
jgi:hypothetical protein